MLRSVQPALRDYSAITTLRASAAARQVHDRAETQARTDGGQDRTFTERSCFIVLPKSPKDALLALTVDITRRNSIEAKTLW